LIDYSYLPPPFAGGQLFVYGMIALTISMSIYLSYNFAYINKDLELQLSKVKSLSEKTLEQERIAATLELERRVMEVENERKSRELEEARELQLSLLPKEIPQYENFDISCFMKTATEVGGDYYDVLPEYNDSLTLAIGDATGHGVKAGTMVAIIKGLFQELSGSTPLNYALERIHHTIRSMRFHNLYMGLTLVRLGKLQIKISSAGMPPIIIYNKENNSVNEMIIRHLPLGAPANNIFEEHVLELSPGDVVLLFSDGLPELFNDKKDLFGYDKIKEVLIRSSSKSAGQIIESILTAAADWSTGSPQNDDITMIAVKVN
jgi:serine phosphatase RsbU (regulator of sigma subunit)